MKTTKNQKPPVDRIKRGDGSFDLLDASGQIGIRVSDQLSHVGIELRRFVVDDKRCDRREGHMVAFPKALLPEVVENLTTISLRDKCEANRDAFKVADPSISVWKKRLKNSADRAGAISMLRMVMEVGEVSEIAGLMAELGHFVKKYEASNPHLVEKFMRISQEMIPAQIAANDLQCLAVVEPLGSA